MSRGTGGRKRVLVIDDEPMMRVLLKRLLSLAPGLEVVGAAANATMAQRMMLRWQPDVLTLDINMPDMDGLTFLTEVMSNRPTPVVMVSAFTEPGGELTLDALERGAADWVQKPNPNGQDIDQFRRELIGKVSAAASTPVRAIPVAPPPRPATLQAGPPPKLKGLVAIGASTGGVEALRRLLPKLPAAGPPVLVVQHLPEFITGNFALRLDALCAMKVKEAREGDPLVPGHILIAPGGRHLVLRRTEGGVLAGLDDGPKVRSCRPSVDVLFRSIAEVSPPNVVGVILTGMGSDGANGLALLKRAGGHTIAQDEMSCVVFGMPNEAIKTGAVDHVLPLEEIAAKIIELCRQSEATDAASLGPER